MQLYVIDERKRAQYKFKENEGLLFSFDIEVDKAEEIVQQMVEQQLIPDSDIKHITKLIKDKVISDFLKLKNCKKCETKLHVETKDWVLIIRFKNEIRQ